MGSYDNLEPAPFVAPRFGGGGLVPGVDTSSNSSVRQLLDESISAPRATGR